MRIGRMQRLTVDDRLKSVGQDDFNAAAQNKKGSDFSEPFLLEINPGGDLRSRVVTNAVSSALRSLTAVFGMGTGVTPAVRPPENCRLEARG